MIIVDQALAEREKKHHPVSVGMVGAGFMARGIARQIIKNVSGMTLVAVCNRTLERAETICLEAGIETVLHADDPEGIDRLAYQGGCAVLKDLESLCAANSVDVILEVTGDVEYGARVATAAIAAGKHFVTMNAELDATIGPLLKHKADQNGVVYSGADGDQPGVQLNLYRFVKGIGANPVLCGNIKGLHDPYRTPATQAAFARKWGQNPYMVTSFADGTKISFEQAVVANATGMQVNTIGMHGPAVKNGTPVQEAASWYPEDELLQGPGIVDYVVGASPAPGVFVLATCDDPMQQHYLNLYKLGQGPFYCFYVPYHLCHFEVPNSLARAVLFNDPTVAPLNGPQVEVVAAAKAELPKGTVLDALGGFMTYGVCISHAEGRRKNLLPMGLAEGCRLKQTMERDQLLTFDDVVRPPGRLAHRLWNEQNVLYSGTAP